MSTTGLALFALGAVCLIAFFARGGRVRISNSRGNINTGNVAKNLTQTYNDHSNNASGAGAGDSTRDAYDWANLALAVVVALTGIAGVVVSYLDYRGGTP